MQIQKSKTNRKKVLIIVSILVILLGIAGYFAYTNFYSPNATKNPTVNYDEATSEQKNAGNTTKEESINSESQTKPNSGSDQAAAPIPQADGRGKITTVMTAANQNGSVVQIRFDIGGVTSTGTCTLTLKKGSTTVTKSAGVQALAGSTTCKGFDIPTSELSQGTWQATLHFENSDLVADTTGTVEVQ